MSDNNGWVELLNDDFNVVGHVKLEDGIPVQASLGFPNLGADKYNFRDFPRYFGRKYPGYTLGEWKPGEGFLSFANVTRKA